MDSFVLSAYASFTASRTFLQQLLAFLNFRIRRFILLLQTKKIDIYELWQQHKQLKTMAMREAWPDISYVGYIHQSQPEPTHKIHCSCRITELKDILPSNISQMITKNAPISTRIVISYEIKWDIPLWIWWKVNGNWDTKWSEVPNARKVIVEQILVSEERKKPKRAGLW